MTTEYFLHRPIKCTAVLLVSLLATCFSAQAQTPDKTRAQEFLQQQEQAKKAALMRELDSAVTLMDNGVYAAADKKFRHVLENMKSVPSDLTYYFGKNSFHLALYKQSIDWLNKYIQLKGTTGQFSRDAIQWKKLAEAEYMKEKSKDSRKVADVLSADYDIDCGPTGKVLCPVCKGDHVTIKKGPFGDEYKTCQYCNEQGVLTCMEFNQLIRGELKPKNPTP
jgi:tetratricopeptide (TPR) repeat protein